MLKRWLAYSFIVLGIHFQGFASHIVGGEMYYDYLGNNQYRIYVALYRDCASTGAAFDSPLLLGVFNSANQMVMQVEVPFPGSTNLPVVFNNPCVTPPSGICTERAIYITVITLPPTPDGYTCSYQRCCRGPNISNLNNPDDTGITLTTRITGTNNNALVNSSPRFLNYPPLVICNNENLNFNHSATDPDGDSLAYELTTPFAGANSFNPAPNPVPAPNYPQVSWAPSFSANVPLGAGSTTTINPTSGALFVDANALGLYVVGIRVKEYRNGVLINSTVRDFLFRVVNCVVELQSIINEQEQSPGFVSYCQGLTFTFDNQSWGGSNYAWDFGVPGITTDVSTAFEPTYTFPAPGTYNITLIVNPGWTCSDTMVMPFTFQNPLQVDFTYDDSLCFDGNSSDFAAQLNGHPGTELTWTFGNAANPQTATGAIVNDVSFNAPGNYPVKLVGNYDVCSDSITHTIVILPQPGANFNLPVNYECNGLTQTFTNASQGATNYRWDFGVAGSVTDVSTATNPTFTFPAAGTYTVTLIASIGTCTDTIRKDFTVYEPLDVSFTHNDSLCITDNSFNFVGNVTGPSITTYSWNFGPNATPSSAQTINVNGVVYDQPGQFTVTLTGSFLNCSETATSQLFVFREPEVNFGMIDGLQCVPFEAHFIDSSVADTPISYLWNFGDGGTSTEQNPVHVYTSTGQFPVTLQIWTAAGCIDTLTMTRVDLINVHPRPVSAFSVDPPTTDICHSTIQFTDHSFGAISVFYSFDDLGDLLEGPPVSTEDNPSYTYLSDGTHWPYQIATNEFGCKDTSRTSVFIEPFTVYVPNAFTPDGNDYNNEFYAQSYLDAVEWEMSVYNRWGELLFKTNDQYAKWDGFYEGQLVPSGVYTYVVRYISCAEWEGEQVISGHVTLLR